MEKLELFSSSRIKYGFKCSDFQKKSTNINIFFWTFPVHRTKIYKIWAKFHLLLTFPCSVVFFHSALFLDVSLQFVIHPKTFSLSHESFSAILSSRRQLGVFLTVVFRATSCHLSPNPPIWRANPPYLYPPGQSSLPKTPDTE